MPDVRAPFVLAVSDYGHLDIRFVRPDDHRPSARETLRWLPSAVTPCLDWLSSGRVIDGALHAAIGGLSFTGEGPADRALLTGARLRAELWIEDVPVSGRLLFEQYPESPGIQFTYSTNTGTGFVVLGQAAFQRWPENGARLMWAVAGAPLPGSAVEVGRWHVRHGFVAVSAGDVGFGGIVQGRFDPDHGGFAPSAPVRYYEDVQEQKNDPSPFDSDRRL